MTVIYEQLFTLLNTSHIQLPVHILSLIIPLFMLIHQRQVF